MSNLLAVMVVHTGKGDPMTVPYIGPIMLGIFIFLMLVCLAVAITERRK